MTTAEQAFIDEIVARGGILVETWETPDPDDEDAIILHVCIPVEEDPAAERAAAADAA